MPYTAPRSELPAPPASRSRPLLPAIGLIVSALCGLLPLLVVPAFAQTFSAFGADLPWATALLIARPWLGCALPLLVLALWWLWPRPRRDLAACVFGVVGGLGLLALMAVALYLPIFKLAATV